MRSCLDRDQGARGALLAIKMSRGKIHCDEIRVSGVGCCVPSHTDLGQIQSFEPSFLLSGTNQLHETDSFLKR
jgi:hypothetical protein